MEWFLLGGLVWIAFAVFMFWAQMDSQLRKGRSITRGDIGFALYLAAHGPLSIGAAIAALCDGRYSGFWSKKVWPKRPR